MLVRDFPASHFEKILRARFLYCLLPVIASLSSFEKLSADMGMDSDECYFFDETDDFYENENLIALDDSIFDDALIADAMNSSRDEREVQENEWKDENFAEDVFDQFVAYENSKADPDIEPSQAPTLADPSPPLQHDISAEPSLEKKIASEEKAAPRVVPSLPEQTFHKNSRLTDFTLTFPPLFSTPSLILPNETKDSTLKSNALAGQGDSETSVKNNPSASEPSPPSENAPPQIKEPNIAESDKIEQPSSPQTNDKEISADNELKKNKLLSQNEVPAAPSPSAPPVQESNPPSVPTAQHPPRTWEVVTVFNVSYFRPQAKVLRDVYAEAWVKYDWELFHPIYKCLYGSEGVGYTHNSGHSLGGNESTSIRIIPLSFGLNYLAMYKIFDFYVGAGPRYFFVNIHNNSSFVTQRDAKSGFGGFVATGFIFHVTEHFVIDVYGDYAWRTFHFKGCCQNVERTSLQVGGLSLGGGIGWRF